MQAAFVFCLEEAATDRTVLLVDLPGDVLVFIAAGRATEHAAQLSQWLQTVLALGAAGGLQTDVRLMPLHRFKTSARAIAVVHTALCEERRTLRALHLLRRPTHVVLNASGPCGAQVAILVAVLSFTVAVVEHHLTKLTAFHLFGPLFFAYVLDST